MSSVSAVPIAEPKLPLPPAPQGGGGEPFSDYLESAARPRDDAARPAKRSEPSAPPSRAKARSEAAARGDAPERVPTVRESREAVCEPCAEETADAGPVEEPAGDTPAKPEAKPAAESVEGASTATMASLPVAAASDDAVDAAAPDGAEAPIDLTGDVETSVAPEAAAADAAPAPTQDVPVEIVQAVLPAVEAETAIAPAMPADGEAAITEGKPAIVPAVAPQAAASAPAATATAPEASLAAPPVADGRAAAINPEPARPSPQAPATPAIAAPEQAAAAPEDAPDLPQPLQQDQPKTAALKPQEIVAPKPSESAPPPAPSADASAPRVQASPPPPPVVTPEPVRALAASFNPASLQAANPAEPNPVPLKAAEIAVEIVSRMREGLRRFDIRLDPPELGRVDVRLEVDRNGHATTRLTVDRPETLELLQRDARGLERALQQAGLKTEQGGLEFSLRQQTNDGQPDGRPARGETAPDLLAADEGERIEAVIGGYRAAALARGGVDIRV